MSQNRLPLIAGLIAFIALLVYSSVFVVNERQQAIVLRFGQIVDVKTQPADVLLAFPVDLHGPAG